MIAVYLLLIFLLKSTHYRMWETYDKAFFHELGHFIANSINHLFHLGGSPVYEFKIYPCEGNPMKYCGHIKKDINTVPYDYLPQYLASVAYGCIFQSYYEGKDRLNECCNEYGRSDMGIYRRALEENQCYDVFTELMQLEKEYHITLLEGGILDEFLQLNPDEYLIPEELEHHFVGDLTKLNHVTSSMIERHIPNYLSLVEGYKAILETAPH